MDLSEKHVSRLINGEVQLTPEVAVRLEMVLGVPARFWNNLEAIYREKIIKAGAEDTMDADIELARQLPYNEMAGYGWVPETRNAKEKVNYLRRYFEVVGLTAEVKDADRSWTSFFHELAHIILGHIGQAGGTSDQDAA